MSITRSYILPAETDIPTACSRLCRRLGVPETEPAIPRIAAIAAARRKRDRLVVLQPDTDPLTAAVAMLLCTIDHAPRRTAAFEKSNILQAAGTEPLLLPAAPERILITASAGPCRCSELLQRVSPAGRVVTIGSNQLPLDDLPLLKGDIFLQENEMILSSLSLLVAEPQRLIDHLRRRNITLERVQEIVIASWFPPSAPRNGGKACKSAIAAQDVHDICFILTKCPRRAPRLLFTADPDHDPLLALLSRTRPGRTIRSYRPGSSRLRSTPSRNGSGQSRTIRAAKARNSRSTSPEKPTTQGVAIHESVKQRFDRTEKGLGSSPGIPAR